MTATAFNRLCAAICFGLLALLALTFLFPESLDLGTLGVIALGTAFTLQDADSEVKKTFALSNGAGATQSAGINLGHTTKEDHLAECELLITAPALNTTQLPDTETMTWSVEVDDNASFSSATVLNSAALVQTGAGGAGAAAATARVRLPSNVEQYVRVKATKTGTGDCSGLSGTAQLMF